MCNEIPKPATVFTADDMVHCEPTEAIEQSPYCIHFLKWLGDLKVPIDRRNYPRMFNRFMELGMPHSPKETFDRL